MILLASVVMAATGFAQGSPAPGANINPAVFDVNGELIYAAEISMVMQNIAGQMGGRDKIQDNEELVQMATQRVIEQKLLSQEATRLGIQPNELRVAQMAQAFEKQAGGREALDAALAMRGTNYEQIMETIREMDLVRSLIEQQISPSIQVSDEDVALFYADHPEMFVNEAQVHARHIITAAGEGADSETVAKARAKAEKARERALAGEDFAELARELSEGPSAPNGGDLGFFSRDQMVPAFADAAFALEPGQISEVVRSGFGFHVIKVEEKRPAGTLPLDEVSDELHSLLVQQRTGEEVGKMVEALADTATSRRRSRAPVESSASPQTRRHEDGARKKTADHADKRRWRFSRLVHVTRSRPSSDDGRESLDRAIAPNVNVRRGGPIKRLALSESAALATPHPLSLDERCPPFKQERGEAGAAIVRLPPVPQSILGTAASRRLSALSAVRLRWLCALSVPLWFSRWAGFASLRLCVRNLGLSASW